MSTETMKNSTDVTGATPGEASDVVTQTVEKIETTQPDGTHAVAEVRTEHLNTADAPNPTIKRTAIILGTIAAVALAAIFLIWSRGQSETTAERSAAAVTAADEHGAGGEHASEAGEVKLDPETLASAGFEYEGVTQRPAIALLRVTGTIEPNPRNTQQVSPLVGGRIETVGVAVGDRVGAGAVLATLSSPEIAEMHGKLHEAETALAVAERNYERVRRAENRAAVIGAKARLDEAEATLRRVRRLVELGAGAGKDLIAAEAAYRTAKADYDFQSNISLNREVQEARAGVETSRVDVSHIRYQMRALGVTVKAGEDHDHTGNSSLVLVRAPAAGVVTERAVNPGAGISAGANLFTISNLSSVFAIANVPESQLAQVRVGTPAEIRTPALGDGVLRGQISYVDPRLDETTRTARARIELPNPGGRLRAGVFVEVGFQTTTGGAAGEELVVPSAAVQRIGEESIVFIPKEDEPGAFERREIEIGGESDGYVRVLSGLKAGERVVTKGSFTLKTQTQKGEMGDEHGH